MSAVRSGGSEWIRAMGMMYDPDLRRSVANGEVTAAVIPVGSMEQHGPHLPVSTDSDIVTEVAQRVANDNGFVLLPTLCCGVSFEHAPYFNLSIRESTLQTVLMDLCDSLAANQIKTAFIINGHHGNKGAIKGIEDRLRRQQQQPSKERHNVFLFNYWEYMRREFDHAGFVETSLMLAVAGGSDAGYGGSVRMDRAEKGVVTDGMPQAEIKRLSEIAQESFPAASKNGVWGDPTGATDGDGEMILAEVVGNLNLVCRQCLNGLQQG